MAKTSMIAKLTLKPGRRDDLVAAFKPMFEAVNNEAGTEVYVLSLDEADDNVAWVYELYSDSEAMAAHSGSEAMAALFGAVGDLVAGAPEFNSVTPVLAKGVSV